MERAACCRPPAGRLMLHGFLRNHAPSCRLLCVLPATVVLGCQCLYASSPALQLLLPLLLQPASGSVCCLHIALPACQFSMPPALHRCCRWCFSSCAVLLAGWLPACLHQLLPCCCPSPALHAGWLLPACMDARSSAGAAGTQQVAGQAGSMRLNCGPQPTCGDTSAADYHPQKRLKHSQQHLLHPPCPDRPQLSSAAPAAACTKCSRTHAAPALPCLPPCSCPAPPHPAPDT